MSYTIEQLSELREREDKVEFKAARRNFEFAGGEHRNQANRRKCFLGYIVALSNEGGGTLVLGMIDEHPHEVTGSNFAEDEIGNLEDEVYERLQIRVRIEELFDENGLRVLVTYTPSRPVGRTLKFEGVPLMRTGESLRNMSDEQIHAILSEQENDFSATICRNLTIEDLDERAIVTLREKYSLKQQNEAFLNQSDDQVLSDLDLLVNGQLTYAALILLGNAEKIRQELPQCLINLEYRDNPANIQFDNRKPFIGAYFLIIDDLWKAIEARNRNENVQLGSYIINIPELNNEIIRESVNNAVAHRDYTKTSEITIKQSKTEFAVQSHGGFPLGVNVDNILTINSTPRNRLLADVLTKTGLVERSGQGVDKIFYQNLSDGKGFPSYAKSDLFQVTLEIPLSVLHIVFAIFFSNLQNKLAIDERLGVHHVIALAKIRDQEDLARIDRGVLKRLLEVEAVREVKNSYLLSDNYTELVRETEGSDRNKIIEFVREFGEAKMRGFVALFDNRLTRRQVNNLVYNLVDAKVLKRKGKGPATTYIINT